VTVIISHYHTRCHTLACFGDCLLLVSVQNLIFHYGADEAPVLKIPQWSVQGAERVFLHGPSGAGKSTLLNLLAGILLPKSGSIEIFGKQINTMSGSQRDRWRARHIGVVFQQFNLIPYQNAVDNIKLAAEFAGKTANANERARQLLEALGIDSHLFDQPSARLSIGQQQRVAIARAMINQPELLIVDEPTSALDSKNRDAFMSLLLDQVEQQQTALVFVSHDLSLAEAFPRTESLTDINQTRG